MISLIKTNKQVKKRQATSYRTRDEISNQSNLKILGTWLSIHYSHHTSLLYFSVFFSKKFKKLNLPIMEAGQGYGGSACFPQVETVPTKWASLFCFFLVPFVQLFQPRPPLYLSHLTCTPSSTTRPTNNFIILNPLYLCI